MHECMVSLILHALFWFCCSRGKSKALNSTEPPPPPLTHTSHWKFQASQISADMLTCFPVLLCSHKARNLLFSSSKHYLLHFVCLPICIRMTGNTAGQGGLFILCFSILSHLCPAIPRGNKSPTHGSLEQCGLSCFWSVDVGQSCL